MTRITAESGQLVGPDSLGTLTFTLVASTDFIRGDCNGDGGVDVADPLTLLFANFGSLPILCRAACDANGDTSGVGDAVYLLLYQFVVGSPPPESPYPQCGPASLATDLDVGCETPPGCP